MDQEKLALALTRIAAEVTPLEGDGSLSIEAVNHNVCCLAEVYEYALKRVKIMPKV